MNFYLCVLSLVSLSLAQPQQPLDPSRECIYINGQCAEYCPEGTYGYGVGCDHVMPEATCDNPDPKLDTESGMICDFSACYCNAPTVRNTKTDKCVPLKECPKKQ